MKRSPLLALLTYCWLPASLLAYGCTNKDPYHIPDELAGGYVIGKESCSADTTKGYWLIDMSASSNAKQYGDTAVVDGKTYDHLLKTEDLEQAFRKKGQKLFFAFTMSKAPVASTDCQVNPATTYSLKVIFITRQGLLD